MAYKNREDQTAYAKEHYKANRQTYIDRAQSHRKALRDRLRPIVKKLKEDTPCTDCGQKYPF